MPRSAFSLSASAARLLLVLLLVQSLVSCALFGGGEQLSFQLVGIEPLRGESLEVRLAVKLRVQNPTPDELEYDGVALKLSINDRVLARGVSRQRGRVPGFGEVLLEVPVSVSVFAIARQALGVEEDESLDRIPYELQGRLGARRFSDSGFFDLSRVDAAR